MAFPPAAAPTPLDRHRRGGARTAGAILDAAEALFAERGFEGASLRDVAERVGVRAPSLYNHFASKDALYAAVLERCIGPVLELLSEGARTADGRPDSARLISHVMELLARHPHLPRLILHETLAGGRRLTPMIERWIGPAFARAEALIESDPAAAGWRSEEVPLLVLALYHVVVGYFTIADLYRAARGEDLLASPALARQTEFLGRFLSALFPADTSSDPRRLETPR